MNYELKIYFICLVAAMGGLLFGYDWVVIGGAKPFYELYFDIAASPVLQGVAMSTALIGCLIGAMVAGALADKYGRKPLLITAAVLFTVSAIATGAFNNFALFNVARFVGGIGIGVASTLSPMYIAEVAPAEIRGRLVSLNQMTIVLGILAAQIVNWLLAKPVPDGFTNADILASWNGQMGWRWMFWAETVPAATFLMLAFFIPESPRYLALKSTSQQVNGSTSQPMEQRAENGVYSNYPESRQRSSVAQQVNKLTDGAASGEWSLLQLSQVATEVERSSTSRQEKVGLRELGRKKYQGVLVLGIVIAVFQQWCGTNVIFNYAQEIFSAAGYAVGDVLFNIVITGIANVVFTIVALYTVDRLGRRSLMLLGAGGLCLIYLVLGTCYHFHVTGFFMVVLVVAAIACYAMTLGPVTWVLLSEIFPDRVRGAAMAVCTFALWTGCCTLTFSFPSLNAALGSSGTFWIYSTICLCGFLFFLRKLPETKGKSLEELEEVLTKS
ncbi:MAG: sugar porter family MFS transporter [Bacteroidaceae bacterium]|nr:sugar porter family MFS transporter [Bacteroidaceae bacterium]MBR4779486.1 sugar porter family MFS transporter [Bacteroidaceae bacterium]